MEVYTQTSLAEQYDAQQKQKGVAAGSLSVRTIEDKENVVPFSAPLAMTSLQLSDPKQSAGPKDRRVLGDVTRQYVSEEDMMAADPANAVRQMNNATFTQGRNATNNNAAAAAGRLRRMR